MNSMYVIVKEEGEYSGFCYEVLAYYQDKSKAEEMIELLNYEQSLKKRLASITCKWCDQVEYVLHEIPYGDTIFTGSEWNKTCIKAKYVILEEEAKVELVKLEQHKEIEWNEVRKEVYAFWDWWKRGEEDPFFHEKKKAIIREILPKMLTVKYKEDLPDEMRLFMEKHWFEANIDALHAMRKLNREKEETVIEWNELLRHMNMKK